MITANYTLLIKNILRIDKRFNKNFISHRAQYISVFYHPRTKSHFIFFFFFLFFFSCYCIDIVKKHQSQNKLKLLTSTWMFWFLCNLVNIYLWYFKVKLTLLYTVRAEMFPFSLSWIFFLLFLNWIYKRHLSRRPFFPAQQGSTVSLIFNIIQVVHVTTSWFATNPDTARTSACGI